MRHSTAFFRSKSALTVFFAQGQPQIYRLKSSECRCPLPCLKRQQRRRLLAQQLVAKGVGQGAVGLQIFADEGQAHPLR